MLLPDRRHRQLAACRRTEALLLQSLLKRVSRSFYLSLRILARPVRKPISLAYLFCRAADTIADTPLFPPAQRWHVLQHLRRPFLRHAGRPTMTPPDLTPALATVPVQDAERQLMLQVAQCFTIFSGLSAHEQRLVSRLVGTLTHGMEMDLTYFVCEATPTLQALPDRGTLDLYTYYVAGVVGQFWTKVHEKVFRPSTLAQWYRLCSLATHFGKGLQMTNILKDLGKDCENGRCYLPHEHLQQVGLTAADFANPAVLSTVHPLLSQYIWETLTHLDHAYWYVLQIPYQALRLRLGCMWPLLFAIQTLEVVGRTEVLLQPTARIKISRQAVYRTLLLSTCCLLAPGLFAYYYATLRRHLTHTLHRTTGPCAETGRE